MIVCYILSTVFLLALLNVSSNLLFSPICSHLFKSNRPIFCLALHPHLLLSCSLFKNANVQSLEHTKE